MTKQTNQSESETVEQTIDVIEVLQDMQRQISVLNSVVMEMIAQEDDDDAEETGDTEVLAMPSPKLLDHRTDVFKDVV